MDAPAVDPDPGSPVPDAAMSPDGEGPEVLVAGPADSAATEVTAADVPAPVDVPALSPSDAMVMPPPDLAPELPPPPAPVDCQVSDFGPWSPCTKTCGGGQQARTRVVLVPAQHGGRVCPPLQEMRACNTMPVNACGGCAALAMAPGQRCGICGETLCRGADATLCRDPGRTCAMLGATCGNPPDGCGGQLSCGTCMDALRSCSPEHSCACGRPTALYSPSGDLEAGKRATAPDGRFHATSAGVFDATGTQLMSLVGAKGFDWHPGTSGRFALMRHFATPAPHAEILVHELAPDGRSFVAVARAESPSYHHFLAWIDDTRIALGAPAVCTTVAAVVPGAITTMTAP